MSKKLKEYSVPFRQIFYYYTTVKAHDADEAESLAWNDVPDNIREWNSEGIESIESMIEEKE